MNSQHNFYNTFKKASQQVEEGRFEGFEQVWVRVENKLENNNNKRIIPYWKWIAVAASFLGIMLAGWWVFKPSQLKNEPGTVVKNNTVKEDAPSANEDTLKDIDTKLLSKKATALVHTKEPAPRILKPNSPISRVDIAKEKSPTPITIKQEPVTVSGTIMDSLGKPIGYAAVMVAGTKTGTAADSLGRYQLKANPQDSIVFSALGFNSYKTDVAAITPFTKLKATNQSLNEVVVVGYARPKKKDMSTGSESKIDDTRIKPKQPMPLMLQGSMAGLVANSNQAPGYFPQQQINNVRIRGNNSPSSNNNPLFIVNGTVMPQLAYGKIDPSNIERVDVLKSSVAQSIYGSRGTDNVVFITTKTKTPQEKKQLDKIKKLIGDSSLSPFTFPPPVPMEINTEGYPQLVENPFKSAIHEPLSTFSLDVDNASYTNIRRFINNGQSVPKDAVRIEEMINYFPYQYPQPPAGEPFAFHTAYSDAPWNPGHKLLLIGMKAKDIPEKDLPANNFVFLIDVSGSMNAPNKLPLLKSSFKLLVKNLRENDKVSIVVYAGSSGVVLPTTRGDKKEEILAALDNLNAGGSTAGGAGIELAYKIATEEFIKKGNNRVILATDGDFNVGISSREDLQNLIEKKRKSGVFLTCLGYGMGNYKDITLETLANKGNGNYAYIDNMQEADRFLDKEFKGNMYTVAKDVKLQIEFNPQQVQAYRLIGYEDRLLKNEDFVNDTVDAGDVGAGQTVTALYEIIPVGVKSIFAPQLPDLKYSQRTNNGNASELATIKYRYKNPDENNSHEKQNLVPATSKGINSTNEEYRYAVSVAWWGLHLRQSNLITVDKLDEMVKLAVSAKTYDPDGYKAEMIRLMQASK